MRIEDAPRAVCRSCRAEVVWCVTEKGKRMPVDPIPVPGGNLEVADCDDRVPHVRVKVADPLPFAGFPTIADAVDPAPGPDGYVSHFVSCPERDSWRKGK